MEESSFGGGLTLFRGVRPFRTGRMYSTCQPAISGSVPVSAPLPSSVGRWVDGVHGALTTAWAAARKHVVRASPPPSRPLLSPPPRRAPVVDPLAVVEIAPPVCHPRAAAVPGGGDVSFPIVIDSLERAGEAATGQSGGQRRWIECVVPPPCPEHAPGPCTESPGKQVARGR